MANNAAESDAFRSALDASTPSAPRRERWQDELRLFTLSSAWSRRGEKDAVA